jgi:hypothetical protein
MEALPTRCCYFLVTTWILVSNIKLEFEYNTNGRKSALWHKLNLKKPQWALFKQAIRHTDN